MEVGAMGFTTPVRQTVEMEYFYDPTLKLPRNPLMEVVASAMTALPSTSRAFAAKADSVRQSVVRGTPLRTIITEHEDNGRESRTVLEVTKIGTSGWPSARAEGTGRLHAVKVTLTAAEPWGRIHELTD